MQSIKKTHLHFTIAAVLLSSCASFGGYQSGMVRKVEYGHSGKPNTVYLDGAIDGRPACATQPHWRIVDRGSEIAVKQMMAVMSAQALGKSITIMGTGTCTQWPDVEDVKTVTIH